MRSKRDAPALPLQSEQPLGDCARERRLTASLRLVLGAVAGCAVAAAAGCVPGKVDAPATTDASAASDASASAPAPTIAAGLDAGVPAPRPATPPCGALAQVTLFVSPTEPVVGQPARVIAVGRTPFEGAIEVDGVRLSGSERRGGGNPFYWVGEWTPRAKAESHAIFRPTTCEGAPSDLPALTMSALITSRSAAPPASRQRLWPTTHAWSAAYEDLYSTWIEVLFDAPPGEFFSFPALHEIVRDKKRNLLFDHLGAHEDSSNAPPLRPDCADLPYTLRAYFAFKFGLPFGLAECSRGGGGAPPACQGLLTNGDPVDKPMGNAVRNFGGFVAGTLADRAHSGSARTPLADEGSDYYPVPLTWEGLRPGTVFADPYGHVLLVSKRVAQTAEHRGALLAVDAQPDGTVALKRFWRGTFLYAVSPELGGPGFKRFRPVEFTRWQYRRWSNQDLQTRAGYGDLSLAAQSLSVDAFYDAVEDALSPQPVDPTVALLEVVSALEEQAKTRVVSVENGRKFLESGKATAPMPEGQQIFETDGPWEDFSTPSRDLRLLIALDVVRTFPAKVAARPQRYVLAPGTTPDALRTSLEQRLGVELRKRSLSYTRSDGSTHELTLEEVLARAPAFEVAYNPNDCVEYRWGAPEGSPEMSTCKRRAPREQAQRMESVRTWFRERRRPSRK